MVVILYASPENKRHSVRRNPFEKKNNLSSIFLSDQTGTLEENPFEKNNNNKKSSLILMNWMWRKTGVEWERSEMRIVKIELGDYLKP